MANVAERLYEHFLQHSLDFMLLFYLRHPNLMNDNSLCKKLSKCLKDFCVRDQDMSNVDFRTKFFNTLRAKLSPDFSLNPDADFYYAMGDGAKKTVLSLLDQDKWGLCAPYCFQTRGKCSTFFAYRRFEDGLAKVSDLLRRRRETLPRGENIHIEQVYEHCWGKDRFRKLFIDYEVEEAWYQGSRTAKQIELMARTFPRWLYMKLRDLKFVDADTEVRVVVKDKCRDLPSGRKVSFHFIFNVLATSTQHEWVCHRIFSRYSVVKKSITQDKVIPSEFYDDCAVGVDLQTLKGERGYSTPYSKKKEEDPDCVVRHREFHTIDGAYNKDLESVKDRGMVLYLASYTCPDPDTVTYSPMVLRDSEELGKEKAARGAPSKAPAYRPSGSADLPGWFESEMRRMGSSVCSHSAPCLTTSVPESLSRHIGKDKPLTCLEVKNVPCPDMLAREEPKWHVHSGNNVFVAFVKGESSVYVTCTACASKDPKAKPNKLVKYVKGTEKNCRYQWLKFDEKTWKHARDSLCCK